MMIRSIPPASAHLALMPVPAPPPMIGLPAATWARRRSRHCWRVKTLIVVLFTAFLGNVFFVDDQSARPICEDLLHDKSYFLPRQAPVTHTDPGNRDAADAFGVREFAHALQSLFDCFVARTGVPITLLRAEVEDVRCA